LKRRCQLLFEPPPLSPPSLPELGFEPLDSPPGDLVAGLSEDLSDFPPDDSELPDPPAFRLRLLFVFLRAVLGDVEAATLEEETRTRADDPAHRRTTLRARGQRVVLHGLEDLEAVSVFALVVVRRHLFLFSNFVARDGVRGD
jgi:hypothetical protein